MQLLFSDSVVGLFFQVIPITILAGLIYAAGRCVFLRRRSLHPAWPRELLLFLFVCYLTGLINLVLVPANFWGHFWFFVFTGQQSDSLSPLFSGGFNLIPTFVRYLTGEFVGAPGSWISTMLVGNCLMLVPMGVFLPLVFPQLRSRKRAAAALLIPLVIELLQPIMGRSFDTDDLICNALGIFIGWGLVALFRKKRT